MALSGVRVLDLSRLLPGPFATMVLAGLGADVIKIEDLDGGDYLRWMAPQDGDRSVMFRTLNRDKRSLRLDLKAPAGRELFLRLVDVADVVVESFRPGVLDRLGVGFDVLHQRNPRLVLCSISGFGQDGPDRLVAGHDLNYLARAGVLSITGTADGDLAIPGVQIADVGAGSLGAVIAVLAALRERDASGEGVHCDVSMLDGMLWWMSPHLAAHQHKDGEAGPGRMALNGRHPCYRLYRCADGWMSVAALEPKFWSHLCELLGVGHLANSAFAVAEEASQVSAELEAVFMTATRAQWRQRLAGEDVCCQPVMELDQVLADPQVRVRGTDAGGDIAWFPVRLGTRRHAPVGAAPGYGEHSRAVLAEVGVDDVEFQRLVDERVTA